MLNNFESISIRLQENLRMILKTLAGNFEKKLSYEKLKNILNNFDAILRSFLENFEKIRRKFRKINEKNSGVYFAAWLVQKI